MPLIRLISDGRVGDQAPSFVYSLTTQAPCAKGVHRADGVGTPLLRAPNVALTSEKRARNWHSCSWIGSRVQRAQEGNTKTAKTKWAR